jgi:hypothetical protein
MVEAQKEITAAASHSGGGEFEPLSTLPAIFTDPLYQRSGSWTLSTSNVTTPMLRLFCFGPVSSDGYGIGYMIFDESIPTNITSLASSTVANADDMAVAIQESLLSIRDLPHSSV